MGKMAWLANLDKIFAALTVLAELGNIAHVFPAWEQWVVLLLAVATLVSEFVKPELSVTTKGN